MTPDNYWLKQATDKPLFADLLWSRPENKAWAGKLAIVGGNLHGFAAPAEAYAEAEKAGVGVTRVLLPLAVKKLAGGVLPELEYAESNPSGSFGQKSYSEWTSLTGWSDGTLLAGDFGRNSETAIVIEKFITKYPGLLIIAKDAVDYALAIPQVVLSRPSTTLVLSMAQLQKLCIAARSTTPITLDMDLIRLVDTLRALTLDRQINIITKYGQNMIVASGGRISTTKLDSEQPIWRVKTAAHASVWWIQNPSKPFEALTTSLISI